MGFHKELKTWYIVNKRNLPWRCKTDPYVVWLSEIILQQTKVNQGITYFYEILDKYPNVSKLAQAKEDELLILWQGLGYYSRALNLLKTARIIHEEYNGVFPKTANELLELPGIGSYTAAAIASFCFKEVVPVLDGNVYRFITRFYGITEPINTGTCKKICMEKLYSIIPEHEPDIFNQAIMEFGALHCTPKNPNCKECPFSRNCVARLTNKVDSLPVKIKAKKKRVEFRYYFYAIHENEIAIVKRDDKGIWKNLYELPIVLSLNKMENNELISAFKTAYGFALNSLAKPKYNTQHLLSHIKMDATFFVLKINNKMEMNGVEWISITNIRDYAFHQLIHKFFNVL